VLADPLDPHSVAQAMRYLVDNPDIARSMGESGLHAIEEKYNWECEKEKLLAFYERLTGITSKYQQAC
jgi:glycosyltransferase involved in cell wall biosynthesis